ncbi:hypothetical protein V5O48_016263 [Marasmius crinis-equi]|uniref:Uncharacterized protein n=1 Tax=Marasmius crinis-equi TaxID=585013 RepID=A0ABR3ES65_9AGAR
MCHYLGLPVALQLDFVSFNRYHWTNDVYKTMHEYQVARGFDPSTIDFARSVGYDHPVYKPIQTDSDRFEEFDVIEGRDSPYSRPGSPPVLHRSQIPDESDVDTDDEYSDANRDLFEDDASTILVPDDKGYIHIWLYDDYLRSISNEDSDSDSRSSKNHHKSRLKMDDICTRFADLALA